MGSGSWRETVEESKDYSAKCTPGGLDPNIDASLILKMDYASRSAAAETK